MNLLPRPSFRQLLLVAFLLVALLLAAVSLRGLFTLQGLLDSSQNGARQALQLNGHVERLGDRMLRATFERAAADAAPPLAAMQAAQVPAALVARWQALAGDIASQ